jgi:alpha-galactosidase
MLAQGLVQSGTGRRRRAQKVWASIVLMPYATCAGLACNRLGTGGKDTAGFVTTSNYRGQIETMRTDIATATRFVGATDAEGFPVDSAWEIAKSIRFSTDWRGRNADAQRETQVRLLWTPENLYLRFDAAYQVITVFPDAEAGGRRDKLWDRDVCEAFLQPDSTEPRRYKEIEVAPNGFWIDLAIGPGEMRDLQSGMRRRVDIDKATKSWRAVLKLPMKSLVQRFDAAVVWRANFYRIEGEAEPRFYSAWQPTRTAKPNFHVPEAFGRLVFAAAPQG